MRILSGIQPSGAFHIGNYFGMMEPSIRLQDEGEAYYFIADYHALTTVQDGELDSNEANATDAMVVDTQSSSPTSSESFHSESDIS